MKVVSLLRFSAILGSDMDGHGGMVYQDEDGNLIMYNHDEMGEEDDEHMDHDGDDYGMEGTGSPGVSRFII